MFTHVYSGEQCYTEVVFVEGLFCTQTVHLGPGLYIVVTIIVEGFHCSTGIVCVCVCVCFQYFDSLKIIATQ